MAEQFSENVSTTSSMTGCGGGGGGGGSGGFSPRLRGFVRMFDHSFPACAFFYSIF